MVNINPFGGGEENPQSIEAWDMCRYLTMCMLCVQCAVSWIHFLLQQITRFCAIHACLPSVAELLLNRTPKGSVSTAWCVIPHLCNEGEKLIACNYPYHYL